MSGLQLPVLHTAWHVDQAILSEDDRLVVIRWGKPAEPRCMEQDEILGKIAEKVKNFAVIYTVDLDEVTEFTGLYELQRDTHSIIYYRKNKIIQCDFGTGNNNKQDFIVPKDELIDIMEVVYRAARKGKGLAVAPKDYSTRYLY